MKCLKASLKKRFSRTGKGNPSNYARPLRGHTWKKTIDGTKCSNCNKYLNHHLHKDVQA